MTRALAIALVLVGVAGASPVGAQEPRTSERTAAAFTGRVERVDTVSRGLTLRAGDGQIHTVYVAPNITLFDELKPGDAVRVRVVESVVVATRPNAKPTGITDTTAAAKQQSTTSNVVQQLKAVVTVNSVDAATSMIVYTGGDNRRVMRSVADPALLQGLKAGDVIEVTFTRERALELARVP
jgi:Cu/Ag efflux protein CusF